MCSRYLLFFFLMDKHIGLNSTFLHAPRSILLLLWDEECHNERTGEHHKPSFILLSFSLSFFWSHPFCLGIASSHDCRCSYGTSVKPLTLCLSLSVCSQTTVRAEWRKCVCMEWNCLNVLVLPLNLRLQIQQQQPVDLNESSSISLGWARKNLWSHSKLREVVLFISGHCDCEDAGYSQWVWTG